MISRRNIRVKVMQMLYVLDIQENPLLQDQVVKMLGNQFDLSTDLFIYLIHFLTELAKYAETDATVRAARRIRTEEDMHVNISIVGNELLRTITEHPSYNIALNKYKPQLNFDKELVKRLYRDLIETQEYKSYSIKTSRDKKGEREILEFIFTSIMLPNDLFQAQIEELYNNWNDDAEMLVQMMQNFLQKPNSINFQDLLGAEKWDFGKNLITTVLEKKELALELIKPKLKNWDADRIAILDMILMQMGICEFLFFETIPPKVTINEYIDLAKDYSTPQSGQFVNGILDNIHKELISQDKMHKIAYKPS